MLFLRLLGKTLLLAAFAALAYDGARILASPGEGLLFTSLSTHLKHIPQGRELLESFFLNYAPPSLWNGIIEPMLVLPVSILFGAAGALIFLAGYRRPPPEIVRE
ncbi:MAG TPA: hypothetical protein VNR65_11795 [Geobacterales bacterium]|nr:hypothetical protein [Geobacterales bacterium]